MLRNQSAIVQVSSSGELFWLSGTSQRVLLRGTRLYRINKNSLISRLPFQRLVREIAQDLTCDLRFHPAVIDALQEITESYMVQHFAYRYHIATRCVTV